MTERQYYVAKHPNGKYVRGLGAFASENRIWISRATQEAVREEVRHCRLETDDLQQADYFNETLCDTYRQCIKGVVLLPARIAIDSISPAGIGALV